MAAQFPLLFSPQKSQKFEEDRIAPTTKYALSQMSKVSNRVVDNENFNWVQSNITTSPAVKDHKTPQSKKLTNSSKRNKSKLVLAEPKQKVTSTPTSAANSKSVLKTLKSPSAVSQKKRSDQVVNVLPATNKAKPETPQLQTAGPVQNSVEFLDIYTHCDVQESMIVNFEVEDRLWTPIPRISKARIVESSEAHDAVSQGAIELSDIYEDKMSEVEEQAGITVTISCNAVHTPVLDLALSPENPESTRFEDIYGAAEGENDSMFVNIVANDVAKTPYIPSLKSLLNGERGNVETSLLEMLSPAGTDSMISLEADEIADNRIIDEIDEVHNQTVIRRSLVLSSLKAFISSMDVNIEPQVTCDIQASELQEVSTPDLLEGKIHSRESLEDYWQSACRDPGSLATPAKDAEPAEVPQEVVCAISEMTSAETQQQAMKPHLDQYSLNSTAQFRIESVAYEIRYDHVKYVVQGQVSNALFAVCFLIRLASSFR